MKSKIEVIKAKAPLSYAVKLSNSYSLTTKSGTKKNLGQYFTPIEIAKKMSAMVKPIRKEVVNILDPGCGTAILASALIQKILTPKSPIKEINLDLYEIDDNILDLLGNVINNLKLWTKNKGVQLKVSLCHGDFILTQPIDSNRKYDVVITNPPYFKLSKSDPRSIMSTEVVHGQPNIYSIFLTRATDQLKNDGQLIFITPRSFTSGKYFQKFRDYFFQKITIKNIHVFESRNDAFRKDDVLQETILMKGIARNKEKSKITISRSKGISDISNKDYSFTCYEFDIIDLKSINKILFIPSSKSDLELLRRFSKFSYNLENLGIKASTGPVVFFRNSKGQRKNKGKKTVPLIWLNNIFSMNLEWPNRKFEKKQHISSFAPYNKLLVESKNYVLVRRFSAKGDKRRLVVAPYFKKEFGDYAYLGIENKVNYLGRKEIEFDEDEIIGLSALLSSSLYNNYFVILNGNTNVSVNDLNQLPLPSLDDIRRFGAELQADGVNEDNIELGINKIFK